MKRAQKQKQIAEVAGNKRLNKERKQQQQSNARYLIDDQADEGDDSETEQLNKREDAYYDPNQLARRN